METAALFGVKLTTLFSLSGAIVLPCWLLLLVAPRWRITQLFATFVAPLLIAVQYVSLLISHKAPPGGGFNSLAQVSILFSSPFALLAGWVHYLAFDLSLPERGKRAMPQGSAFLDGSSRHAFY